MSYLRPGGDWRRAIAVTEIVVITAWGGSIVAIADSLSGPFSVAIWLEMAWTWLCAPLLVTGGLVRLGYRLLNNGTETVGSLLIAAPLLLTFFAAIWALFLR